MTLTYTAATSSLQLQETPPRQIKASSLSLSPSEGVTATPVKCLRNIHTDSGVAGDCQRQHQEVHRLDESRSIYDSLGWDDEDDLL